MTDTTTAADVRPERTYTVTLSDESGSDYDLTLTVDAGTEHEQDAEAERVADEAADEWVRGGEWGHDGACVTCYVEIEDARYQWRRRSITVEIEPDHRALITAACDDTWDEDGRQIAGCGADPDDHEWAADGEGGCDENPGVWSTGGTSLAVRRHCRRCGLQRHESYAGPQRNPGEHDTVAYVMSDAAEIAAYRASGAMDEVA